MNTVCNVAHVGDGRVGGATTQRVEMLKLITANELLRAKAERLYTASLVDQVP